MFAILRREFAAYFHSPIGYIFVAVFYLFAGLFFFNNNLMNSSADLSGVFSGLFSIVLFTIPVLTMRLLSEERKNKTEQALLTAPITITGMVMGKFLAAACVYLLGLTITLVYGLAVAIFTPPNWPSILGNFIATLLLGAAMISIGMFISSMTENQVIAAVGGFAASLLLLILDVWQSMLAESPVGTVIGAISFYNRYASFSMGIFEFSNVLFFLSVCGIFIFLTVRVFEKRRWS